MFAENKIPRSLEWALLLAITGFAIWLRFYNLGRLGLWGDEGFTFLSVQGILNHGYPLLPSGNPYFKNILFSYLSALPTLFFGLTELGVRFVNAFWGVALIPLFYFFVKKYFSWPVAIIGALLLTMNHWEIEFSRHARYYCQLQFFYLLSLICFNLGFVEGRRKYQWWAFIFFVCAALTHQLAYTLIFCFIPAFGYMGFRYFFRARVFMFIVLYGAVVALLQSSELFLWKVGSVVQHEAGKNILDTLLDEFHFGYFRQFEWLFPNMCWIALVGGFYYLFYRKSSVSFYMAVGFICLIFMGLGNAHFQPRYVFYLFPIFLLAYLAGLYLFFTTFRRAFIMFNWKGGTLAGILSFAAAFFLTVNAVNPHYTVRLTKHNYGKKLINKFQPSTTFSRRIDYKTAAEYVKEHAGPEDLILGMHMVFNSIYAGRLDYWLWSAGPGAWDAYTAVDGKYIDRYIGVPLIRNLEQFQNLLNHNKKRRIWVITTPSWNDKGHIQPDLAEFLRANQDKVQYHSRDGISKAFLFQ